MKRYRKLYYVPGMISLLLLPFMVFVYIHNQPIERCSALEVIWGFGSLSDTEFQEAFYKARAMRKFNDLKMDADEAGNSIKLAFGQQQIQELIMNADTLKGIHFYFAPNSRYEVFVQVLNVIKTENVKTHLIDGNDIWVFNYSPKPLQSAISTMAKAPILLCGTDYHANTYEEYEIISEWDFIKQNTSSITAATILFIILVWLGWRRGGRIITLLQPSR